MMLVAESLALGTVEAVLSGRSVLREDVVVEGGIGIGGCIVCDGVNKDVAKPDVKDRVGKAKLEVTLLVVSVLVFDEPSLLDVSEELPLLVVSELPEEELPEEELSVVEAASDEDVSVEDSAVLVLDSKDAVVVADKSDVGSIVDGTIGGRIGV